MRQLAVLLCLSFAVLLFSAGEGFALPPCTPGDDEIWHNCFGTYTWSYGDKYVGEFRDHKRHGQGTYSYASGDKYVGEYRNDKKHGQGTYSYASGDKYVGEYRNDKKHGQGTATFADGENYVGEFRDHKRHGQGTYSYASGDKYVGEYRNDKKHGQGTYTSADGRVKEGIFKDGEFQYARKDPKVEERRKAEREAERRKQERIAREKREEKRRQADNGKVIAAASGTGFVVSKSGHIITNNHVINGCQEVKVHTKGDVYKVKVLRRDTVNDLAVIKASFQPSWVFSISGDNAGLMEEIYVAGYPFGARVSSSVKITRGIVSSLSGIGDNFSQIQIDAALQPGNSGGPIIDENGDVVGVAVAKLDLKVVLDEYGVVPEGTNFGIKGSVVRNFLEANGVKLRKPSGSKVSLKELGQHITDGTLFLTCWMTYAQIEKLRTEKVMFKDLQ